MPSSTFDTVLKGFRQGLRKGLKSRGQSVMNFSKWGQKAEYFSKSIGATETISKIEGSI